MVTNFPFFSILIPTKNRPDILKLSLSSLIYQNFKDFEVIVSDNSDFEIQEKNLIYINKLNHPNIKYVKPPHPLNMHDNWEFGFRFARGKYQGVLIDKTLLKQNALFELHDILKTDPVDLINYLHSGIEYNPRRIFKFKRLIKEEHFEGNLVEHFSPKKELERRLNLEKNIRSDFAVSELRYYNFGKICFGFYNQTLVERIKSKYGRLFHHIACDYNSCALALCCAKDAILYNKELLLAICNIKGNGRLCETKSGAMLDFLKTCDPALKFFEELPIPFLYTALHNICAYDYQIVNRLGELPYRINIENLVTRCVEDLTVFPFATDQEKTDQWTLLTEYAKKSKINLNYSKSFEWIKEPESFRVKLSNLLFKKNTKQKLSALLKRITFDLKYTTLKSLLS